MELFSDMQQDTADGRKLSFHAKMVRALVFVREDRVHEAFAFLVGYVDNRLYDLLRYLETNYIGAASLREFYFLVFIYIAVFLVGAKPLFPYAVWGVYTRTLEGRARTNNAAEGMNNAMNLHFSHSHPTLGSFIQSLRTFTTGVMADFRDLNAKRAIIRHNKKWDALDEQKRAIVQDFDSYDEIKDYLAAIAATLLL
jgi:hypothetical protein